MRDQESSFSPFPVKLQAGEFLQYHEREENNSDQELFGKNQPVISNYEP
jgi:hypothetical protein